MYAGFKAAGVIGLILGPIGLMLLKNIFSRQIEKGLFKDIFDEK
jgi:predicted PurR-regulated permease PerM